MAMATVDIDELLEKQTARVVELTKLAEKVGETKGKLDALDDRVAHNCARNEENFKNLDDKFTLLTTTMNNLIQKNADYIAGLKVSNRTKLTIIVMTVFGLAVAFIGGSYISWHKIGDDFDKTTVQQRAGMVKDTVETISKVIK